MIAALVGLLALFGAVSTQEQVSLKCKRDSIEKSLPDEGDLTLLKAALQYTDFEDALAATGGQVPQVTILAPINDAFKQLFSTLGVNGLAHIDPTVVLVVLLNHLITGPRNAQSIIDQAQSQPFEANTVLADLLANPELLPDELPLAEICEEGAGVLTLELDTVAEDPVLMITQGEFEAIVLETDIEVCGSLVHKINTVLVPSCNVPPAGLAAGPSNVDAIKLIDEGLVPAPVLGIGGIEGPVTAAALREIGGIITPAPAPALAPTPVTFVQVPGPIPSGPVLPISPAADAVAPDAGLPPPADAFEPPADEPSEGPISDREVGIVPIAPEPAVDVEPPTADEPADEPAVPAAPVVEEPVGEAPVTLPVAEEPAITPEEVEEAAREGLPLEELSDLAPEPIGADFFAVVEDLNLGEGGAVTPEQVEVLTALAPEIDGLKKFPTRKLMQYCIERETGEQLIAGLEAIQDNSAVNIKKFVNLLRRSDDLIDYLTAPDTEATVFIPINALFAKIETEVPGVPFDITNEILRYHIIPGSAVESSAIVAAGSVTEESFVTDDAKEVCESTLLATADDEGVKIMDVPVVEADIPTCDTAVIFHILSGGLNPQCGNKLFAQALEVKEEAIKEAEEEGTDEGDGVGLAPDVPVTEEPETAPTEGPSVEGEGEEDDEDDDDDDASSGLTTTFVAVGLAMAAALFA